MILQSDHSARIPFFGLGDPASYDPEVSRQRTEISASVMADLIEKFLIGKGAIESSEKK